MLSILLNLTIVSAALFHLRMSPTLTKLLKLAIWAAIASVPLLLILNSNPLSNTCLSLVKSKSAAKVPTPTVVFHPSPWLFLWIDLILSKSYSIKDVMFLPASLPLINIGSLVLKLPLVSCNVIVEVVCGYKPNLKQ